MVALASIRGKQNVWDGVVSCPAAFLSASRQTAYGRSDTLGGDPTAGTGWFRDWQVSDRESENRTFALWRRLGRLQPDRFC